MATSATKTKAGSKRIFRLSPGKTLFWGGMVVIALLFVSLESSRRLGARDEYVKVLRKARAQKDHFLRFDDRSPLPHPDAFDGLYYFAPDWDWRVESYLLPLTDTARVWMPTSDSTRAAYRPAGWVQIPKPGGGLVPLVAYRKLEDRNRLFIPFADETNGEETSAQGRYIDLIPLPGGRVLVDFNMAYHPYCVFNPGLSCPLPPPVNRLPFPIRAGETLED